MASRIFEPSPRWGHFSAAVKEELYVFGGVTEKFNRGGNEDFSTVHIFNQHVESWQTRATTGSHPPGLYNGACASSGQYVYHYGGCNGSKYQDSLHRLDTGLLEWSQLPSGPMKKDGCRMIVYQDRLILFGGYGYLTNPTQPGAEFVRDERFAFNGGWTNELHSFDMKERKWSSPPVTGKRPPPCSNFTFTLIGDNYAILYGEYRGPKLGKSDESYVLDLISMNWHLNSSHLNSDRLKLRSLGPVERDHHTAVCLDYGKDDPHLLVTGGRDKNDMVLRDTWLLDIWGKQWKEVVVPGYHQPRFQHSATAFRLSEKVTEVTIFGGCPENSSDSGAQGDRPVIANTTVLQFEKTAATDMEEEDTEASEMAYVYMASFESNRVRHTKPPTEEWVLKGVADNSNLGLSQRIDEKRLLISSTKGHAQAVFIAIGDLIMFQENIGNGAFAAVYKAEYKGEVCAAKMLLQHARDMLIGRSLHGGVQDAAKLSIQKECSFLENLQHENVVRHITTAIEPRSVLPILVIELMDCSLKKFISEDKPLGLNLQLTICHGVSSGLHYLHSKDVIHRDLCDDNVLLTRPPNLKAKISDFGMSTILDYESMSATMTAVGHRRGYLPPEGEDMNSSDEDAEDYYDKARYSHHLDIYSFGAVATQTVRSVEHLKSRVDLKRNFKQIAKDHPLKEIIAKCIDKDSKLRPQACIIRDFIASTILNEN